MSKILNTLRAMDSFTTSEIDPVALEPVPTPTEMARKQQLALAAYRERFGGSFEPSIFQVGIFDFVVYGKGDGIVAAVAGSGKTTTLVYAARLIKGDALFVAFNKHIAEALSTKLAGTQMVAKTIHSVGYGMVASHLQGKRLRNDTRKYRKIIDAYLDDEHRQRELLYLAHGLRADGSPTPQEQQAMYTEQMSGALGEWCDAVKKLLPKLVDFARLTLTPPEDAQALRDLMVRFDLMGPADVPAVERAAIAWLPDILDLGEKVAEDEALIDFTDMIWLPEVWNLKPRQVAWVFVDECQDLNAAQLALVLRCRKPGGRMLFVGDARQAIMGFAGADSESFWKIQRTTHAKELPLSICYRCPTSHLDLAKLIVPEIEARPGAPEGILEYVTEEAARKMVQPGDMVLCRMTAPLVAECMRLIKLGVPARVRGHDIGKRLADMVLAVTKLKGYTWEAFGQGLSQVEDIQRHKLVQHGASESQLEALADQVEAIRVCHSGWDEVKDAKDLADRIEALFSDEVMGVLLSTVHRAKGLENERVFIIRPDKLPLTWPNQQDWEAVQEDNIHYVALTRGTSALYFVQHV